MDFRGIESILKDKEKCDELLSNYETKFLQVKMIAERLESGEIKTQDQVDEILAELTGLYMLLDDVVEIVDTYKTGEEGRLNFLYVNNNVKAGEKVVQAQLDKIVSNEVQYLRRLRNIFSAYRNSADKAIISCQSRLKRFERKGNYKEE